MNTNNKIRSRETIAIAFGLLFVSCYITSILDKDIKQPYSKRPNNIEYTSNIASRQCVHKTAKSIKVIPTSETYEVSQWITSGDWSHDDYPLTVTIPSQKVLMDVDYVEDHWDDYLDDPEDEIRFPPDIFQ